MAGIDRVAPNDVVNLAADRGPAPYNFAIVLLFDGPEIDLAELRQLLAERVRGVPRLRRRLRRTPLGCGRPVWVDDPAFDIAAHVTATVCPAPGDEAALLDVAAGIITNRLPRDRPLWRATLVSGLHNGRCALIVVLHHVMADGIAGLAILAALLDGTPPPPAERFPHPAPHLGELFRDATRGRLAAIARLPGLLRTVWATRSVARRPGTPFGRTSLNAPTGPHRRLAVARADVDDVRAVAHEHGATVNDVALTAVAGALSHLLRTRGETLEQLAVSVPAAARTATTADALGNDVGLLVALLPMNQPDPVRRLAQVAAATREAKSPALTVPPAAMTAVSRVLVGLGLAQFLIDHQRLVHTFVTNVRGPAAPLSLMGCTIRGAIPVSIAAGNVTVAFGVFSYAGTLTITLVADPVRCPDLDVLAAALQRELEGLVLRPRTARSA